MFRLTKTPSQESDVFRSTDSPVSHHVLDLYFEDNKKSLGAILSSLPGVGLKRKLSSDMRDLQSLDVPNKIPKKGLCCGLEKGFLLHILRNGKLFLLPFWEVLVKHSLQALEKYFVVWCVCFCCNSLFTLFQSSFNSLNEHCIFLSQMVPFPCVIP